VPSHYTFYRVFCALDPDAFAARFGRWVAAACEGSGLVPIAIDGKAVRGAKRANAEAIHRRGGYYLLAVKGNQPTLRAAVEGVFERACEAEFVGVRHDTHVAVEDGHGRHEERGVTVVYDPDELPPDWPGVRGVVQVCRERVVGGVRTSTTHY
jgi:hypothetical protein